ncbi:MAG: molybdopterin molybdotransferase MoeA [Desulfuromonadales bacterium]|nr:molybdopterin molybdotransferase MoeA [Desulfuromonadales bacterium]
MAISFEKARGLILDHVHPLEGEPVDLLELVGRVLAEDVRAPWDMPRWDNSEMDGFAVRAADCGPAARLSVEGFLPAGVSAESISVGSGTAVRIMTGAPIPVGCDAVVPIEETMADEGAVILRGKVTAGDYIRRRGGDIAAGEVMVPAGTLLRPAEVNLLASFAWLQALAHRRPEVAILSTGDELVSPGETVGPGQIIDSNAYSLAAAVREIGAIPRLLGIARDNRDSLGEKIGQGLQADVLVTSAGASKGDLDLVGEALAAAGVEQLFWKVGMKPGGPTAFGLKEGKPVFSLPGNPVSSMIGFEQLVRPALLKMMGRAEVIRPYIKVTLKEALRNETDKVRFLRVWVEETVRGLEAVSAGDQNTGILSTMIRANGIAILPADRTLFAVGEQVNVQLLHPDHVPGSRQEV